MAILPRFQTLMAIDHWTNEHQHWSSTSLLDSITTAAIRLIVADRSFLCGAIHRIKRGGSLSGIMKYQIYEAGPINTKPHKGNSPDIRESTSRIRRLSRFHT